jgi:glycosyltransferase involved in cell wall biosynthesis
VRVVHFSDTYLPRRDGVITSIRTLAHALAGHGYTSTLFAPRHPETPHDPGLALEPLPSVPSGVANLRLAAWPRSRHVASVATVEPDVVHVHTPGPVGLLGILAAHRLGLPLVQTYHTDLHAYLDAYRIPTRALHVGVAAYRRRLGRSRGALVRGSGRAERRRALLDAGSRLLLEGTDALVVPTRAVLSRAALPFDPSRIAVIPTGVAHRPVSADEVAAFRAQWGLTGNAPTVLFVGRVNREKGIDLLLPAFARLVAAEPAARLVLVGAVYERGWLDRLLATHGIADRVTCTGELPSSGVAAAYAAAQVFAFPSRTDTQGLVLQEAALAGLPAVLVDAELHTHGALAGQGFCAEPTPEGLADALVRVLRSPALAASLVEGARSRALAHTPDRYAAAMVEVYQTAAAHRRGWSVGIAA